MTPAELRLIAAELVWHFDKMDAERIEMIREWRRMPDDAVLSDRLVAVAIRLKRKYLSGVVVDKKGMEL